MVLILWLFDSLTVFLLCSPLTYTEPFRFLFLREILFVGFFYIGLYLTRPFFEMSLVNRRDDIVTIFTGGPETISQDKCGLLMLVEPNSSYAQVLPNNCTHEVPKDRCKAAIKTQTLQKSALDCVSANPKNKHQPCYQSTNSASQASAYGTRS